MLDRRWDAAPSRKDVVKSGLEVDDCFFKVSRDLCLVFDLLFLFKYLEFKCKNNVSKFGDLVVGVDVGVAELLDVGSGGGDSTELVPEIVDGIVLEIEDVLEVTVVRDDSISEKSKSSG